MNKLKTVASLSSITVCISKVKLWVESPFLLEVAAVTGASPEAETWEGPALPWVGTCGARLGSVCQPDNSVHFRRSPYHDGFFHGRVRSRLVKSRVTPA